MEAPAMKARIENESRPPNLEEIMSQVEKVEAEMQKLRQRLFSLLQEAESAAKVAHERQARFHDLQETCVRRWGERGAAEPRGL